MVACLLALTMSAQTIAPKREFRGAWIQCVNGQFQGMTPERMQHVLTSQLDVLQKAGINAIIFQVRAEADALKKMLPYLGDVKRNFAQINLQCERITEIEHAADDVFAEYIGFIFTNDKDAIEIMKYKNIAEAFESATDAAKVVSDCVRKMILRYVE